MLLEAVERKVERSVLAVILMTLFLISMPPVLAGADDAAESSLEQRISRLTTQAAETDEEIARFNQYLIQNPLPANADQEVKSRYSGYQIIIRTMENRSKQLKMIAASLTKMVESNPDAQKVDRATEILNNVENELAARPIPKADIPSPIIQTALVETRRDRERIEQERFGDIEYQIEKRQREQAQASSQSRVQEEERQRKLQEEFGDIEYEIEKRQREEAQASSQLRLQKEEMGRQRKLQEDFGDIEYEIEERRREEAQASNQLKVQESERQRRLQEQFGDIEYQMDQRAVSSEPTPAPVTVPTPAPVIVTTTLPPVEPIPAAINTPRIGENSPLAPVESIRPSVRPPIEERKKLSDILIDPMEDFNLLPNRVGARQKRIRITGRNVKIRVIGTRNGMYKVELYESGVKQPGTYFISKRWAHKTLNFTAALSAINGLDTLNTAGEAPVAECKPGEDQPVDMSEIRDAVAQDVVETSSSDFKPGCEVLSGNLSAALQDELKTCLMSIKRSITQNARDDNGRIDRDKLFCNMYKNLRPEEQHFAGSLFTSVGEAGIIATSNRTENPGSQEQVFVMKVLDNRLRKARENTGNSNLNALDMSLIHKQFSMYNSSIFPDFRDLFEPSGRAYRSQENKAIEAFISYQSNPGALEPADQVDNMNMYFNPHGMTRISNLRANRYGSAAQRRERARSKVQRLKRAGKIPQNYPNDRIAPDWDYSKLEPVNDLSYNGVGVRKRGPYMHKFYSSPSAQIYYGQGHPVPPSWRNRCSN